MSDVAAGSEGLELADVACVDHEMVEDHELEPKQLVDIPNLANAYSCVRDEVPVRDVFTRKVSAQFRELQIGPLVLNSFLGQDNSVLFYTCESLYNIAKQRAPHI
ncbi:hypothetical protein M5K25_000953 [Dendrobium thyrsiflorum]|uniref:Uncharacterized protein n=1 Tax=Dendrobium thyrsiflorum TaxID=117978 RepID=A0ABD0VV38_DENTH